jgi:heme O synthase-like polyprenyltransferase
MKNGSDKQFFFYTALTILMTLLLASFGFHGWTVVIILFVVLCPVVWTAQIVWDVFFNPAKPWRFRR